MQKDRSKDSNESAIGEIQANDISEEKHVNESEKYDTKQQISLADVGVQTSRDNEKLIISKTINQESKDSVENEKRPNLNEEKSIIAKLKKQLEEAQVKIKELENEQFEAEKRRAIEISTKYIPTSFKRYQMNFCVVVDVNICL